MNNVNSTNGKATTETPIVGMQCYQQPFVSLYNEDCRETMKRIPDGSIDLLLQDTPFGCTQNEWDIKPIFAEMWPEWERITKDNGAMIFFGTQPFASELILSRSAFFKYDLIWEKSIATGFLNANKQPLRAHESILVFYRKQCTYNPIKINLGTPSFKKTWRAGSESKHGGNYGKFNNTNTGSKDGSRFPRSVFYIKADNESFNSSKQGLTIHPTQKPLDLIRYLILTYTNKGETVFDGYSGSGTTAAACLNEGREFIGSELNEEYFKKSVKRLEAIHPQLF